MLDNFDIARVDNQPAPGGRMFQRDSPPSLAVGRANLPSVVVV
jgi:hypothetical protein